jgi:hypothetical protein
MLTHQTENQLDGTILLGEFATVRHDCSFLPPFFSRYLRWGTRGLKLFPGISSVRIDSSAAPTVRFLTADDKAVNPVVPIWRLPPANRNGIFYIPGRSTPQTFRDPLSA